MSKGYRIVGVMSGTSCDGLDMALCSFSRQNNEWKYVIERAKTIPYSREWKEKLQTAHTLSGYDLLQLHNAYGYYIGEEVKKFAGNDNHIDFISSHGHTIFHQPSEGLTFQLGNGACIAAVTNLTTVCDFRTLDVAMKGQGAPLVPVGDLHLFTDYHYCLNLGGFANISYSWHNKRIAYDICPVNIALNYLARQTGEEFDKDGIRASKGEINIKLLKELNSLRYYYKKYPKSLSREWFEKEFLPVIEKYRCSVETKLRTLCEHIAIQLSNAVKSSQIKKVLVTGGGAHNKFLISRFKQMTNQLVVIPNNYLIDYKEALIFAYLGLLRMRGEHNCLSSVTGAKLNHSGGVIYQV